VIQDLNPTGASAFSTLVTEEGPDATLGTADDMLTDATSTGVYVDPGNLGYYIVGEEGEKFFNDVLIFAGHVIAASYLPPDPYPTCGTGTARLYIFELGNSRGFFDDNATAEAGDRHFNVGSGVPSSPRVTIASDPDDDMVFITTSDGQVLQVEPPLRQGPESSMIYWRQVF
jgi:hypothetical protein